MRAIAIAGLVTLVAALPAQAALPPQYQRQAELRAIIDNIDVVDAFGFDGITAIVETATDVWEVRSGNCTLEARIVDIERTGDAVVAGPREFTVEVGEPVCN